MLAYTLHASFLVGFDFGKQGTDSIQFVGEHCLQGCAFLDAESNELLHGFGNRLFYNVPLLVADRLRFIGFDYVRHTQHSQCAFAVGQFGTELKQLLKMERVRAAINGRVCACASSVSQFFGIDGYVHLTALQLLAEHSTDSQFLTAERR